MRKLIIFILFFMSIFIFLNALYAVESILETTNNTISTKDLKNHWLVINYWAAWCDNCIEEIPALNKFNHYIKVNRQKNILLYGVNYDNVDPVQLKKMTKAMHIEYPNFLQDPKSIWNLPDINVIPVTFIINKQGKVAATLFGTHTSDELIAVVNKLQHAQT